MTERPRRIDALELVGLRIDGGTQPRASIDESVVAEYADAMEAGADFPEIVVFFDGADHWLADGFHRYHAAGKAKKNVLAAELRQGTRRDAVLYSVGANTSHGMRRTNADKRKAVETLLADEEWRDWSSHEISRRCGVSDHFVGTVRRERIQIECGIQPSPPIDDSPLPSSVAAEPVVPLRSNRSETRFYVDRQGKQRTMEVARIGPSTKEKVEVAEGDGTPKRKAVEAALRKDPMAGTAAIAKAVGCSTGFVNEIRGELGMPSPKSLQAPGVKTRSDKFDRAVASLETYGEILDSEEVEDFGEDDRLTEWVRQLDSALLLFRRVRGKLVAIIGRQE